MKNALFVLLFAFFPFFLSPGNDNNAAIVSFGNNSQYSMVQYSTAFDVPNAKDVLTGKIGKVSPLPDPQAAPYEDCLFTAEFFPVEKDFVKTILVVPWF